MKESTIRKRKKRVQKEKVIKLMLLIDMRPEIVRKLEPSALPIVVEIVIINPILYYKYQS